MIVGITGTLGAGKGTVVDYLVSKGFAHYSARSIITEEIQRRGLPVNRDTMTSTANDMRRIHGAAYPQAQLYDRAVSDGATNAILESVRSVNGALFIKERGGILLAVDADPHVRYQRITARGSETDSVDFDTFIAQEQREMSSDDPNHQNLRAVAALADYTIQNDGTLDELHAKVDAILQSIEKA